MASGLCLLWGNHQKSLMRYAVGFLNLTAKKAVGCGVMKGQFELRINGLPFRAFRKKPARVVWGPDLACKVMGNLNLMPSRSPKRDNLTIRYDPFQKGIVENQHLICRKSALLYRYSMLLVL